MGATHGSINSSVDLSGQIPNEETCHFHQRNQRSCDFASVPPACNRQYGNVHFMADEETSTICTVYSGVFHHLLSGRFCLHIMFQDVASSQDFINITSRLHKFWSFPPKLNQPSTSKQLWIMWTTIVQRLANHEFLQTGMWPWGKKKSLSSRPSSAAREPTWMSQEVKDPN